MMGNPAHGALLDAALQYFEYFGSYGRQSGLWQAIRASVFMSS